LKTGPIVMTLLFTAILADPARGQQRPLVTEDPETIGSGRVLIEGGFDYFRDVEYPVSGLTGDLIRVPTLGASFGVSSIAEMQFDWGLYERLAVTGRRDAPLSSLLDFTGDRTSSMSDPVIATKIRFASETSARPAMGLRVATKLPFASNESGLGLDTTDFFATLLLGKTIQSIRVVGNVGVGILGDPTNGNQQNDIMVYGVSLARALTNRAEIVAEVNGRAHTDDGEPPPGTQSQALLRLGARFTHGPVRIDGAAIIGLLSDDPSFGLTTGFTYVFNAFRVP
jgi:hypothetical protein